MLIRPAQKRLPLDGNYVKRDVPQRATLSFIYFINIKKLTTTDNSKSNK
jgi:hypothetical protein